MLLSLLFAAARILSKSRSSSLAPLSNLSSYKPSPPPSPQPEVISEPASTTVENENVPMPEVVEEVGEPMSDIEVEFRELVNGLLAAGVDPTEMMDDPRWEDINERATAVGFETWPVFLELATME